MCAGVERRGRDREREGENNLGCSITFHLVGDGVSLVISCWVCKPRPHLSFWGFSCLPPAALYEFWDCRHECYCIYLYVGSGDLTSGHQVLRQVINSLNHMPNSSSSLMQNSLKTKPTFFSNQMTACSSKLSMFQEHIHEDCSASEGK